ncbi:hypothetical protein [Saccharothrix hoggarensis]|uniref:Lipoprotein n=1 Tax=Saccharothrix hoggarensis TaxID=913853 RepID=A0ABW3R5P7_9PSEU
MKHVQRSLLAAVVGSAALVSTACGPKDTGAADAAGAAKTTTAVATPAEPTTADGHTSPGMRLKIGERAVVPANYNEQRFGTVAITVTAIEPGDASDLERFPAEQVTGVTPVRIRFTVEFVKGDDLSGLPMTLVGRQADGSRTGIGLAGESTACDSKNAGDDFTTPGAKFESCSLAGSKDGLKVETAAFNDGGDYRKNPILWGN